MAEGALSSGSSLPHVSFRDLEGTVSCCDRSGSDLPESFLDSLRSILVVSVDHGFAIADRTVVDSLASYCSLVCSFKDPIVGPSQGWGSMHGVFRELVGVVSPSLPSVGASGARLGAGVGPSLGFHLVCRVSPRLLICSLLSFLFWCRLLYSSCCFSSSWLSFPFLSSFFRCLFSSSDRLWCSFCRLSLSLWFSFGSSCRFLPCGRFGCSSCRTLSLPCCRLSPPPVFFHLSPPCRFLASPPALPLVSPSQL